MARYAKVENGQVARTGNPPKVVYDPQLDEHIKLDSEVKRNIYGWYFVHRPQITDPTKVHGAPVYDAVEGKVSLEVVDRVYEDVRDENGDVVMTALEAMKAQRLKDIERIKMAVREDAVDWIIERFTTNGQWSAAERKVFNDFYAQLDTWRGQVNAATDVKELHRMVFDPSSHREKMRNL